MRGENGSGWERRRAALYYRAGKQLSYDDYLFGFEKNRLYGTVIRSKGKGEMFKMQIGSIGISLAEGTALLFLCICAVFDIKKREMPISLIIAGMAVSAGFCLWQIREGDISAMQAGISILPGVFFLLVGRYTEENVGYGDGLMLVMIGFFAGGYQCFKVLCYALVLSAVFALVLLALHKAEKGSRIAFVPFLAIGMGVALLL